MSTIQPSKKGRGFLATATVASLASQAVSSENTQPDPFLSGIKSGDSDTIFAAWKIAEKQPPSVIEPLGKLLSSKNMAVAKGARESIMKIVHSVGKTKDNPKRKVVTNYLLKLLDMEPVAKMFAFRALSLIADDDSIPYIAKFITDKEWYEEAIFCLERMPGERAIAALIDGLKRTAEKEIQMRLMAALGHRKAAEGVDIIAPFVVSEDKKLALAAIKAVARIGVPPNTSETPDIDSFSPRDQKVIFDNVLRYSDALIAKGDTERALKGLKDVFENRRDLDEHIHCAIIVTLSKIDLPETIKVIGWHLQHDSYIVRDTAKKALIAMKGTNVDAVLREGYEKIEDNETKKVIGEIIEKRKG